MEKNDVAVPWSVSGKDTPDTTPTSQTRVLLDKGNGLFLIYWSELSASKWAAHLSLPFSRELSAVCQR